MTRTEDLEAALRADWSDEALSVYADHLQSIGDPRGELIALDLEGADGEGAVARRGELMRAWLTVEGGVSVWWNPVERRWYAGDKTNGTLLVAEYGLLELAHAGTDGAQHEALLRFLANPASRFVHRVSLGGTTRVLRDAVSRLTARDRPWLRALALRRLDTERELVLSNTTAIGASLPNLVQLELTGRALVDELDHAGVTELMVTGPHAIRLTGGPPLPSVTTLDFAFSDAPSRSLGAAIQGGRIASYIQASRLPNVRRLVLSRQEPNRALALARLSQLDLAERITYLELPALRSASDVEAVERASDAMPALREVVIARAYLCFGDRRVELARARVRHPAPWPWRPLDDQVSDALHIEDRSVPIAPLLEVLEQAYDELPPDIRGTWFRIWNELETMRQVHLPTSALLEAIEVLELADSAWQNVQHLLQHSVGPTAFVGYASPGFAS